jgi:hypothetical protein
MTQGKRAGFSLRRRGPRCFYRSHKRKAVDPRPTTSTTVPGTGIIQKSQNLLTGTARRIKSIKQLPGSQFEKLTDI